MTPAQKAQPNRPRILLVEDDDAMRASLEAMLEDDYDVVSVSSVKAALARLESNEFDILLSDYQLPGEDGASLVAKVHARTPEVMILLLTGQPEEATRATEQLREFVQVLAKPCEPDLLQRWLSRASSLGALRRASRRMRALTTSKSGIVVADPRAPARTLWVVVLVSKAARDSQIERLSDSPRRPDIARVTVVESTDREACLLQVTSLHPDAIVADSERLGPDAGAWLGRLRALPSGKDVPVLVMRPNAGDPSAWDRRCFRVASPAAVDVVVDVVLSTAKSQPPTA